MKPLLSLRKQTDLCLLFLQSTEVANTVSFQTPKCPISCNNQSSEPQVGCSIFLLDQEGELRSFFCSFSFSFPLLLCQSWGSGGEVWVGPFLAVSLPRGCTAPLESHTCLHPQPLGLWAPSSLFCSRQSVQLSGYRSAGRIQCRAVFWPYLQTAAPPLSNPVLCSVWNLRSEFCNRQLEETYFSIPAGLYLKWFPCGRHLVGSCILLTPPSPVF